MYQVNIFKSKVVLIYNIIIFVIFACFRMNCCCLCGGAKNKSYDYRKTKGSTSNRPSFDDIVKEANVYFLTIFKNDGESICNTNREIIGILKNAFKSKNPHENHLTKLKSTIDKLEFNEFTQKYIYILELDGDYIYYISSVKEINSLSDHFKGVVIDKDNKSNIKYLSTNDDLKDIELNLFKTLIHKGPMVVPFLNSFPSIIKNFKLKDNTIYLRKMVLYNEIIEKDLFILINEENIVSKIDLDDIKFGESPKFLIVFNSEALYFYEFKKNDVEVIKKSVNFYSQIRKKFGNYYKFYFEYIYAFFKIYLNNQDIKDEKKMKLLVECMENLFKNMPSSCKDIYLKFFVNTGERDCVILTEAIAKSYYYEIAKICFEDVYDEENFRYIKVPKAEFC